MYRVNHIFYSLQGEGYNTGRPAVFVRFAGCNMRCPFCDTEFDSYREMTGEDIVQAVSGMTPAAETLPMVVLTGGEPTLQVDEALIDLLHRQGYWVAMESNGTRPAPKNLDWLTVSPKGMPPPSPPHRGGEPTPDPSPREGRVPDEIKLVFTSEEALEQQITHLFSSDEILLRAPHPPYGGDWGGLFLQPCDTGDPVQNEAIMRSCVHYIKQHPQWRLSLQTHKLIGIE